MFMLFVSFVVCSLHFIILQTCVSRFLYFFYVLSADLVLQPTLTLSNTSEQNCSEFPS